MLRFKLANNAYNIDSDFLQLHKALEDLVHNSPMEFKGGTTFKRFDPLHLDEGSSHPSLNRDVCWWLIRGT